MPFQAYTPSGFGFLTTEDEEFARMQEEARLREKEFFDNAPHLEEEITTVPPAPEQPGFLSRAGSNFSSALTGVLGAGQDAALAAGQKIFGLGNQAAGLRTSPLGEAVPGLLKTAAPLHAALIGSPFPKPGEADYKLSDLLTPRETLEKPWLDAPNKEARAAAQAAERLTNVKSTPEAQAAQVASQSDFSGYRGSRSYNPDLQSSRPVMNVTIDGKTYDYSDPSVRAPKLTGDTVNLRPRGPGAFASYYDPATKNVQTGQRLQEIATLPADKRPGVSIMEPSYVTEGRAQLPALRTRQALGEARRAAERAEMSPREAAMLDPRVISEQIKAAKPERLQQATAEVARVTGARTAEEYAGLAIQRAIQADPRLAIAYKHAQAGDSKAAADFMKAVAPIKENAMKEYNGMIISAIGSDPYKQDPLAGLSLTPTPPGS